MARKATRISTVAQQRPERPAGRVERGTISAEQIVAGAMDLADEIGLEQLSMPKLAAHLGYGVTSIYWYFRNKNELIEALVVEAARRFHDLIHPPQRDADWQTWTFELFMRQREAMRGNPLCCDLLFMRGSRASEDALLHMWPITEEGLEKLTAAGFTAFEAMQNFTILSLYARGCVVLERQMRQAGKSPDDPTPVPSVFPLMRRALDGQNTRGVDDASYAAQLKVLIEGMDARLRRG